MKKVIRTKRAFEIIEASIFEKKTMNHILWMVVLVRKAFPIIGSLQAVTNGKEITVKIRLTEEGENLYNEFCKTDDLTPFKGVKILKIRR